MNETVKKENREMETTGSRPVFIPATDIYETADAITVVADMPGVAADQIDIRLENQVLSLSGEQAQDPAREGFEPLHCGYRTGTWRREFTLTTDVDADRITARIHEGVLTVTLPKSEKVKPRKIEVQRG
jgi:HSP20 family protein